MADDILDLESGVIYTDTQAVPDYTKEEMWSGGYSPDYPVQTRTYTVATGNWDMTRDYTASGLAAKQKSWTRTEYHN